jgi:hypothetical protein
MRFVVGFAAGDQFRQLFRSLSEIRKLFSAVQVVNEANHQLIHCGGHVELSATLKFLLVLEGNKPFAYL